jgi:urease accessory protein
MGEASRITVQDFVTPPELADYRLAISAPGRIGGVRLHLSSSGGRTRLGACYQQVPLRLLPLAFDPPQPALIYLINPTAGLFDGDAHLVEIDAGRDTRTFVTGQSATRIHPCLTGLATQQWRVRVGPGAILLLLPGPAIPFQSSRYYQRVEVDLAEGAHFVWGDIWLAGRYARGADSERFQFRAIVQDMTVRREGRLIYRDRFSWRGPWDGETADWHFGGQDAFGSLFTTVQPAELPETKLRRAVFTTAQRDTCVRWLGTVQPVTTELARLALTIAARAGGMDSPWLVGAHALAPTHWFSP